MEDLKPRLIIRHSALLFSMILEKQLSCCLIWWQRYHQLVSRKFHQLHFQPAWPFFVIKLTYSVNVSHLYPSFLYRPSTNSIAISISTNHTFHFLLGHLRPFIRYSWLQLLNPFARHLGFSQLTIVLLLYFCSCFNKLSFN